MTLGEFIVALENQKERVLPPVSYFWRAPGDHIGGNPVDLFPVSQNLAAPGTSWRLRERDATEYSTPQCILRAGPEFAKHGVSYERCKGGKRWCGLWVVFHQLLAAKSCR